MRKSNGDSWTNQFSCLIDRVSHVNIILLSSRKKRGIIKNLASFFFDHLLYLDPDTLATLIRSCVSFLTRPPFFLFPNWRLNCTECSSLLAQSVKVFPTHWLAPRGHNPWCLLSMPCCWGPCSPHPLAEMKIFLNEAAQTQVEAMKGTLSRWRHFFPLPFPLPAQGLLPQVPS